MEIRKDLARDIFNILGDVFEDGTHASTALSRALDVHHDWSDKKRALLSNTVYDIIRNWRQLWTSLGRKGSLEDRHLWLLLGAYLIMRGENVPRSPEYKGLQIGKVKGRLERGKGYRPVRESVPDWLDRVGEQELEDDWDDLLHSLNTYPELAVRCNTLKINRTDLGKKLKEEGHETRTVEWAPDALVFEQKCNVFRLKCFREGLFEVQDPASQMVSAFLDVGPKMVVVDACAGQGGKTLHISSLMNNNGRIIALDDTAWKLDELKKRASRAGAQNIETRHVTGTKTYKRMKGKADRLLMDVPCSGLGSLRRNPDIKWSLSKNDMERLKGLQRKILLDYSQLLKPGGRIVYATCSVLPSEGEEQVRWFIKETGSTFKLLEEKRLRPDSDGFDGFYMASLELIKGM